MSENYNNYLDFANILADASGDILRYYFKKSFEIEQKSDLSPVTQADIEVEQRIRLLIEEKFPSHGIIGEELENKNPDAEFQWVIDPIDGTKSFIAGYPIFTTLIAITHNGKPVLGVINQPILYERWSAISGQKTLYNNSPLPSLESNVTLAQATLATTSTGYFSDAQARKFAALKNSVANTVLGGDGYAYAMLAHGNIDIVVDVALKPYDFCALPPIIEGIGGIITDWVGKPLTLKSDGNIIVSINKGLQELGLEKLTK